MIHYCKCQTPEHNLKTIIMYGKLTRTFNVPILETKEVAWCADADFFICSKCNDTWHTCWAKDNPTDKEVEAQGECLLQLEDGETICSKCLKELVKPIDLHL